VGFRAVGHAAQSREARTESFSVDATLVLAALAGLATFILHFATSGGYGYQRDELYFVSCARHLAWGYVDQPPLIAVVARITLWLFGDSLTALRLLPAVAAAATVVITGRLARRLGGGLLAQGLAMLALALAPFYLAVGNLLTMNAFEPLLWMGATYLFVKALEADRPWLWGALGVVCGLGLINKYSMFFFIGTSIVAIALTPERRAFRKPGFYVAAAIATAFVAPTLIWQAMHQWPQLDVLRHAGAKKNMVEGPLDFYLVQLLMMNPLATPLWIAGLVYLLRAPQVRNLRWYGLEYFILSGVYLALGAKTYYLAPIYPVLLAAGSVPFADLIERAAWSRIAYPVALFASGLIVAPQAFPLLPLPAYLAYQRFFDLRGIKMERHPEGRVPQHFADMLGWDTFVRTMAQAYDGLTPREQAEATILTRDYGQASAIDFFGPRYRLPPAISGHNNYFLYGTRGASGKVVLAVGIERGKLASEFRSIERVGTFHDDYLLPDFNNLPIYKCTDPIEPLAAWWPSMKDYI
jgi:hypothetical protein